MSGRGNIHLIENNFAEQYNSLAPRDSFYEIVEMLNSTKSIGHAICLVGLRRTGKSILLNQLHARSNEFGIRQDEILHVTLDVKIDGKNYNRNEFDVKRTGVVAGIEYPTLDGLEKFINEYMALKKIKCVMIDEITLCQDFILSGKGFVDALLNSGIKLLFAGTESASFRLAGEHSLYTRLLLEDISYIPFGEYCRLKSLPTDSLENKQEAMDMYVRHGNILDDTVEVDEKYLEDAVGVNLAFSIMNSDNAEFQNFENNEKELVQDIVKYYKLLGESVTLQGIRNCISRADISRAFENENSRRRSRGAETISYSKKEKSQIAIKGAEEYFRKYQLSLDKSEIKLSYRQLEIIDNSFTALKLLYCLSRIPEIKMANGAVEADDICVLHSLSYHITQSILKKFMELPKNMTEEEEKSIVDTIESTLYGRLLENIVVVHYIKKLESAKKKELLHCIQNYGGGSFTPERVCTKHNFYKYRNKILSDSSGRAAEAEVDIVYPSGEEIALIEIKKSHETAPRQRQWLTNDTVIQEITDKLSKTKKVVPKVYYMGAACMEAGISYVNIADFLLDEYKQYFMKS